MAFVMKMVGVDEPSRSDGQPSNPEEEPQSPEEVVQLTPEEEEQRSRELQRRLEASMPKRRPKPSRSECEEQFCVADPSGRRQVSVADYEASLYLPQCQKYQELQSKQREAQEVTTFGDAADEYTASDYYDSMRAVDTEHHHTTGTGFIKISEPDVEGEGFHYLSHPSEVPHAPKFGISNPAMNDWIPQSDISVPASTKPSRSESNVFFLKAA